jgi:hypothetical protein
MKRGIQIILFFIVVVLVYMCVTSIRQGMQEKNSDQIPLSESLK